MTVQQIKDGNKMIAEFMGLSYKAKTEHPLVFPDGLWMDKKTKVGYNELFYHSSWDWLMPLVEKIERMGGHITIGTNKIECQFQDFRGSSKVGFGYTKIQCVWEVIVEFIKWYNTQNPKQ